jgi:hypothetical protein
LIHVITESAKNKQSDYLLFHSQEAQKKCWNIFISIIAMNINPECTLESFPLDMSEIFIPSRHQSAPKDAAPKPSQSILRQLHNRVVGVKHHAGLPVKEVNVLTDNFVLGLSQSLLEEARETRAGRFLLELLGATDYAGRQHRPLMLIGHKVKAGGFRLKVVVPINTALRPGPPPDVRSNGQGVVRES